MVLAAYDIFFYSAANFLLFAVGHALPVLGN